MPELTDLFAGPGGFDVAAHQLGLTPNGIEWDNGAVATRLAAGLPTTHGDVRKYGPADLPRSEVLAAGPPCQTYTIAGANAAQQARQTDGPPCRLPRGCQRVAPCAPGCATRPSASEILWGQARQTTQAGGRHTVDTITSDALDQLYAELEQLRRRVHTLEHVARSNRRHVRAIVPELEAATQRAERAEAAIESVTSPDAIRAAAFAISDYAITHLGRDLGTIHIEPMAEAGIRAALDPQEPQPGPPDA
ncbi:DNA cytosine methyltransferase [Streptomyces sp. NPDC085614]|uniref:DNA cytosine methyltransferase n=1 Tax=Streptomyces sp. NPDC085614 TaxID=3365733 RepID=UPI0037D2BDC1